MNLNLSLTLSVATLAIVTGFAVASHPEGDETHVDPSHALKSLKEGNARFAQNAGTHPHSDAARRMEVAKKQTPFATVLTCADSRLSPEIIFDQGIGDLFVTRVAGNTFGKDILGSIEYSVKVLGSRLIVVLGHERCGAVDAAIKGGALPGSIGSVTVPIKPAVEGTRNVKSDRLDKTIDLNAQIQAKRITRESALIRDLVKAGKLKIVAGTYDLDSGLVKFLP